MANGQLSKDDSYARCWCQNQLSDAEDTLLGAILCWVAACS